MKKLPRRPSRIATIKKLPIILAAAFGGMFPSVMRLAITLTDKNPTLPEATYLIGLVLYAVLAAAVAFVFQESNLVRAFYIGIGLPSLLQVGIGEFTARQKNLLFVSGSQPISFVLSAAYAQELPQSVPMRKLVIKANPNAPKYDITFSAPDKSRHETITVDPAKQRELKVPEYAATFYIQKDNAKSTSQTLPLVPHKTTEIDVYIRKDVWSGLYQAVGARNVAPYEIEIKPIKQKTE